MSVTEKSLNSTHDTSFAKAERLSELILMTGNEDISYMDKFLGDENIAVLAEKLKVSMKRKLVLRGNSIGSTGAKSLADLVAAQDSLIHLSLEWNHIGSNGADFFAEALLTNRSLSYLDLRNNSIGSEAAVSLAESVARNTTLRTLDLRWNQIEDRGALAFKKAILERKPSLHLLINGNLLSEATMTTINAWLKQGRENDAVPDPVEVPKDEVPKQLQNEFLQKEIYALRQQLAALQQLFAETQRLLDSSTFRVTELEQQLARADYNNTHLTDQLKDAMLRISMLNDHIATLTAEWDKDRTELIRSWNHELRTKEEEIKNLIIERDQAKSSLIKIQDENNELRKLNQDLQSQLDFERHENQENVRQLQARLHEMSLERTKVIAENNQLKGRAERMEGEVKMLNEKLAKSEKEHAARLEQERSYYVDQIAKLQAEHCIKMKDLLDRNAAQAKEITELQSLVVTLRHEIDNIRDELAKAYEDAIRAARESERQKCEEHMNDLRQRLGTMTSARNELESKCDGLSRDLRTLQSDHESTVQRMNAQLSALHDEVQRLKTQSTSLKNNVASLESHSKSQEIEIADLRKKLQHAEDQASAWEREMHAAMAAKKALESELEKAKKQCQQLRDNRALEYNSITQSILNAVKSEFDHMRVDMKIPMSGNMSQNH